MRLGKSVPGSEWVQRWRFVEDDLHDINKRVQEYDRDARLICDETDRQLGIARWVPTQVHVVGGLWTIALMFDDPETGGILTHADGRVLEIMGRRDSRRVNMTQHQERVRQARLVADARQKRESLDAEGDSSERFVHALRKDVSSRPRTYVPKEVAV